MPCNACFTSDQKSEREKNEIHIHQNVKNNGCCVSRGSIITNGDYNNW